MTKSITNIEPGDWYDEVDHSPGMMCEVELPGGEKVQARWVCGSWETLDGQAVYPARWRFLYPVRQTALYKAPFD